MRPFAVQLTGFVDAEDLPEALEHLELLEERVRNVIPFNLTGSAVGEGFDRFDSAEEFIASLGEGREEGANTSKLHPAPAGEGELDALRTDQARGNEGTAHVKRDASPQSSAGKQETSGEVGARG